MSALAGRVTAAQTLLLGPGVARALAVRTAVLHRRRPRVLNPVCSNAQIIAKDCVESLAQSNLPAASEIIDLLSSYEMEGLMQAHDRIATSTDRTPTSTVTATPMMTTIVPMPPSPTLPNKVMQNANIVNNNISKVSLALSLCPELGTFVRTKVPFKHFASTFTQNF